MDTAKRLLSIAIKIWQGCLSSEGVAGVGYTASASTGLPFRVASTPTSRYAGFTKRPASVSAT